MGEGFPRPSRSRAPLWFNLSPAPVAAHTAANRSIARITAILITPEELRAIVNGNPADPIRVWAYSRPISLAEYDALTGIRDHHEFMAATHVAVDLGAVAPLRP